MLHTHPLARLLRQQVIDHIDRVAGHMAMRPTPFHHGLAALLHP
jgi:hypothetical protein